MGKLSKNDLTSAYFTVHISTSGLVHLHGARKCVTCFVIHVENFTNYPLLCYSFLAADTLRELVTFDLFILVSGHTWRVTYSTCPPSLKILWLSILELYEFCYFP